MDVIIEINFQSDEAIYMQLRNQIIMGIASSILHEGDSLPPVRTLASQIGINMHTVNKAYSLLKDEGFVNMDRRRGAVIAVNADKARAMEETREHMRPLLAQAVCSGLNPDEIHDMVDDILAGWEETTPGEQ